MGRFFERLHPGAWAIYLGPLRFRRLPRLWSLHWRGGWHLCASWGAGGLLPKLLYLSNNGSPPHDTNRGFYLWTHAWPHRARWRLRAALNRLRG